MLATTNIDVRLIDGQPNAAAIGKLVREKVSGAFCQNGPEGAAHKRLPTPFPSALPPCWLPEWPAILQAGLGHQPYLLAAYESAEQPPGEKVSGAFCRNGPQGAAHKRLLTPFPVPFRGAKDDEAGVAQAGTLMLRGYLPLCLVSGPLFGRFLVSLPYLNTAGVLASDDTVASRLIDQAVKLADELDVRYLELRHERRIDHPSLTREMTGKVHMRLTLPDTADELWKRLKAKVRNQVRRGQEQGFEVCWSAVTRSVSEEMGARRTCEDEEALPPLADASGCYGEELLDEFYAVFSRNMRDLGTPVFGRRLFRAIAEVLPERAEFCVVRHGRRPVAAAMIVHGDGVTEVPSASALRSYNSTNVNMLMYWQLLGRAIERGQRVFDFGRSTVGSGTFQFKKQWGAEPHPAAWQYYVRRGDVGDVRPDNARYQTMIRVWQRLPVWLTRAIGPAIVRGIP